MQLSPAVAAIGNRSPTLAEAVKFELSWLGTHDGRLSAAWRGILKQRGQWLDAAQRVPFGRLLVDAAFGARTWLFAAAGGLAMVYFAAVERRDWMATELVLAALAAGLFVAVVVAALTLVWTVARALYRRSAAEVSIAVAPEAEAEPSPAADQLLPVEAATEPVPRPLEPLQPVGPPRKKYVASELRRRSTALDELSDQLDGPIQDAYELGREMTREIDHACRTYTKQEIIEALDKLGSITAAAMKGLAAVVRQYPIQDIRDLGPWDYSRVTEKTGVLALLIPLVADHILKEDNISTPALREAGAEWIGAVNGFGAWLGERRQRIADQRTQYQAAEVYG